MIARVVGDSENLLLIICIAEGYGIGSLLVPHTISCIDQAFLFDRGIR